MPKLGILTQKQVLLPEKGRINNIIYMYISSYILPNNL